MGSPTIFVQIPAYRDSELSPTLIGLYAKADRPETLRTAVAWQYGPGETLDRRVGKLPNLDILRIPCEESRGCNWARRLLQSKWSGEPYTLFLDSHHRFVRGWDTLLIDFYERLHAKNIEKPLITSYLPAYEPHREPGGRRKRPYSIFALSREDGVLVRLTSYPMPFWKSLRAPVSASFLSLHFIFTAGAFNREIPFDPEIYFFGDEVMTGLRAFTWGYDLFHPHRIMGWHCFDRGSRVPHWDDHSDWRTRHAKSLQKMRRIYRGEALHEGGLGSQRSIADYENHILMPLVEGRS